MGAVQKLRKLPAPVNLVKKYINKLHLRQILSENLKILKKTHQNVEG